MLMADCYSLDEIEYERGFREVKELSSTTIYMRFKKELRWDEEGNLLHIDYLMDKFQKEFE